MPAGVCERGMGLMIVRTVVAGSLIASLCAFGADAASNLPVHGSSRQESQQSRSERQSFFPEPGTHSSRTMIMMMPPEEGRLAERIVAAARRNPAWFKAYASQ